MRVLERSISFTVAPSFSISILSLTFHWATLSAIEVNFRMTVTRIYDCPFPSFSRYSDSWLSFSMSSKIASINPSNLFVKAEIIIVVASISALCSPLNPNNHTNTFSSFLQAVCKVRFRALPFSQHGDLLSRRIRCWSLRRRRRCKPCLLQKFFSAVSLPLYKRSTLRKRFIIVIVVVAAGIHQRTINGIRFARMLLEITKLSSLWRLQCWIVWQSPSYVFFLVYWWNHMIRALTSAPKYSRRTWKLRISSDRVWARVGTRSLFLKMEIARGATCNCTIASKQWYNGREWIWFF